MSSGDNQATLRALAFKDRVCASGGAVMDIVEFAFPVVLLLENLAGFLYSILYTNRLIGGIRGDFGADTVAFGGDNADICEGAAPQLAFPEPNSFCSYIPSDIHAQPVSWSHDCDSIWIAHPESAACVWGSSTYPWQPFRLSSKLSDGIRS